MKTVNYDPSEINQFLDTVRNFNSSIGRYEQHTILSEEFTYSVKLTNGTTIRIYVEELQDKKALPVERLKDIAARFNERI